MARTLISFLGTGEYEETTYHWLELGEYTTRYAPVAIACIWGAKRVVILCTSEAKSKHKEGLIASLQNAGMRDPEFRDLPSGRSEQELWKQFEVIRNEVVHSCQDDVLLDITHGFRAQPFFAGAVISVLQASGQRPQSLGVVYGEFRKGDPVSHIWDISLFVDLMDWSRALDLFLRTGNAGPISHLAYQYRQSEAKRAHLNEDRNFPRFGKLIGAIRCFAEELSTLRVAHIITGYEESQSAKHKAHGSAAALFEAIELHRAETEARVPPLALVLDRLQKTVDPLIAERLWSVEGQQAQKNLAKLYLELERYPEAATVLREARVNLYAPNERAVEVNSLHFEHNLREEADKIFADSDPASRDIARVRNDVIHGGFNEQPLSGKRLVERVKRLIEEYACSIEHFEEMGEAKNKSLPPRQTYFVSRHPGAVQWAREQGIEVDHWVNHIDVDKIKQGDIVIGSLPVHLAAEVCTRGGRYLHLSLDLPEEWRGMDLSADNLRACNAHLCEYKVFSGRQD